MFDDILIESKKQKQGGGWVTTLISFAIHILLLGAVLAAGYWVKKNPQVIEKPIKAFMVSSAPPPPPPPPPAPASHVESTPHIEVPQTHHETFITPTETPKIVPQTNSSASKASNDQDQGVVGGVEGGVAGGVVGGVIGGVVGGTLGGQLGGQLGGTGDRPVRVGGDVKAPEVVNRTDPEYTEVARKARIQGIVILEAIIDTNGNVTDVRVLKPLPMGLDISAMNAVRKWKFRPGSLNGKAVPVIFNLTVNFRLQA